MSITRQKSLFKSLQNEGLIQGGVALDLGCGNGLDAMNFADAGFSVDAVDKDILAIQELEGKKRHRNINVINSKIEEFNIAHQKYDLISSQYALQFLSKADAHRTIENMVIGCKKDKVITFTLIGQNDEWNEKWSTWSKKEADELLSKLPVRVHKEISEEGYGLTKKNNIKWWHVLTYVLIKIE